MTPRGAFCGGARCGRAAVLLVVVTMVSAFFAVAEPRARRSPVTHRPTRSSPRTACRAARPREWDVAGAGDPSIQGFATDISVDQGQTINFKIDTTASDYRIDIYRLGYYGGNGARLVHTIATAVHDRDRAAPLPRHRRHDRRQPRRLRQLERVGVVVGAGRRDLRSLRRPAQARRQRRGEPHRLRRARRRRQLRPPVPDVGHDLAGVQQLRRQQPLRRSRARPQGELQPPLRHPGRTDRGLVLQRRVPDAPLARAQRLRRQLLLRHRHRPPRQRAPRARGLHVGGPRRVLVGRAARPTSRPPATPGSTSPSSAATRSTGRPAGNRARPTGDTDHRTLVAYKEGDAQGSEHYNCLGNFACDPDPDTWTGLWRQNAAGHDGGRPENALSGQISWHDSTEHAPGAVRARRPAILAQHHDRVDQRLGHARARHPRLRVDSGAAGVRRHLPRRSDLADADPGRRPHPPR